MTIVYKRTETLKSDFTIKHVELKIWGKNAIDNGEKPGANNSYSSMEVRTFSFLFPNIFLLDLRDQQQMDARFFTSSILSNLCLRFNEIHGKGALKSI